MDTLTSDAIANATLAQYETTIGTLPVLKLYGDGAVPTDIGDTLLGTVAATISLPSDWLGVPASRTAAFLGTIEDTAADATVTALSYFVIFASDGTTPHLIGDITVTGGGGKLTVSSLNVSIGTPLSITGLTLTA